MPNQEGVFLGTSMAVQRLRLCASTAGGSGSIPGWGTKSLHALLQGRGKKRPRKKEKKKKEVGICCPLIFFQTLNGRCPRTGSSGLLFLNTCSHSGPSQSILAHRGLLTGPPASALSLEGLLIVATCQPTQSLLSLNPLLTRDVSTCF